MRCMAYRNSVPQCDVEKIRHHILYDLYGECEALTDSET